MSLENTSTELSNLIGRTLYEECRWEPSGEVSIEGAWYIVKVIGKDENDNILVGDDEHATRTLGVTSFLTPDECYVSLSDEDKERVDKWWLE